MNLEFLGLHYTPNILIIVGVTLSLTFLGSKIFQRLGIPQVVGFIVMGVLLGSSFLNIVPLDMVEDMTIVSQVALGLIGFDMGSHLRFKDLRELGRNIVFITAFEVIGTFALVTIGIYVITQSLYTALLFGALASATAPAATVDVLAEYEAKGPCTTCLLAVVGLDDALALILYSIAAALAESLFTNGGQPSLLQMFELPFIEIGGSLILGLGLALILNRFLTRMEKHHDAMAVSIGFILLSVGISEAFGFSLILTTMIMGMTIVNRSPQNGQYIRFTIEQAGPVIYVLFFALIGARFQINLLPAMGLIGITYVVLRSVGKFGGAWIGGFLGGASIEVRNNLGFGLLSQAGVAIGLALTSASRFSAYGTEGQALGSLIINVITATTFVVQIIGPNFVKFGIGRAGEIGKAREKADIWASEVPPE